MELFQLGSSSKRPDSERLLYSQASQLDARPPTAPLTPNAPPVWRENNNWYMPASFEDNNNTLPPPPSQPPTINLFDSLNSAASFDEASAAKPHSPRLPSPLYSDAHPCWESTDARLSDLVHYLQKGGPYAPLDSPTTADWREAPDALDETSPVDDAVLAASPGFAILPPKLPVRATAAAAPSPTGRAASPHKSGSTSSRHRGGAQSRAPVKGWWKTEICKFWKESGGCRNENNCRWAHGDHELRSPTPDSSDLATNVQPWLVIEKFPTDLRTVWEILKIKNRSMRLAEESALIAGPATNVELDDEYWANIQQLLSRDVCSPICDCCGKRFGSDTYSERRHCNKCAAIAAEKITNIALVPQSAASGASNAGASPSHNDRKKLVYWGVAFANVLRSLDEFVWVSKDDQLSMCRDFQREPLNAFAQHKRCVARSVLLMRCYLESLPSGRRSRLLMTELLPSLSLIDWCVVSNQPILFIALIANEFPIQAALPASINTRPFVRKNSSPTSSPAAAASATAAAGAAPPG